MPAQGAFNHVMALLAKEQTNVDVAETLVAGSDGCDIYIGDGDPPAPEAVGVIFNGKATSGRGAGALAPRIAMPPNGHFRSGVYEQRLKGAGTAYSASVFPPNELHRWFKACGFDVSYTATPTPRHIYTPTPPNTASTVLTLEDYRQQDMQRLRNVLCTFEMESMDTGAVKVSYRYMGLADAAAANTATPAPTITYHAVIPFEAVNFTVSIGAATGLVVRKFKLTQNRSYETARKAINLTGAHVSWVPGGMAPVLDMEIERPTRANYNPESIWRAGSTEAVALTLGQTQYNRWLINLPQAQHEKEPTPANDGPLALVNVSYGARVSTPYANDFLSLTAN